MFLNDKKMSLISPLYYDYRFITDFKEKGEPLNLFFSKQCSLIFNNGLLPSYINHTIENRFSTVALSVEIIGKIIPNLDSNKVHGHDNLSICLLKICGDSVYKPLDMWRLSL